MPKYILIFADGTGQIGGIHPDQCLTNVYKMYRAMRPGPDSPIKPEAQVAFYDPGLGAGEVGGFTFKRIRKILASAVGTGIDENIIDCYQAIIASYEPGDKICLFGFSRGAYTVRSLANVLNLCGVPTKNSDGGPVPRHGPKLRKIASDAVRYVYNHGAGAKREKYEAERETKAERFRQKYGSSGKGADGEPQGNVQPYFIGVFDTVAALQSRLVTSIAAFAFVVVMALTYWVQVTCDLQARYLLWLLPILIGYWVAKALTGQIKYFFEDPAKRIRFWNPLDWLLLFKHGHIASWSKKNYDCYVDREVRYLRHAMSIDEARADFQRVGWGRQKDLQWYADKGIHDWLIQVWFAGCHSDIGGSYPESESRLSDIALSWMISQIRSAMPNLQIRDELIVTSPDPLGLQHDQRQALLDMQPDLLLRLTHNKLTWKKSVRQIPDNSDLHPSVLQRLKAPHVPQMGEVKPYRPENLSHHKQAHDFYD